MSLIMPEHAPGLKRFSCRVAGFWHAHNKAFTLAELLIALSILGVIAIFTIPKLLQNQQDSRRIAVFKETLATISNLNDLMMKDGSITTVAAEKAFVKDHLNYAQRCATQPDAEGCWNVPDGFGTAGNADGYILHNGATITSFNGSGLPNYESLGIDWNGPANGPNQEGNDIIYFKICWGSGGCGAYTNGGPTGPGSMGTYSAGSVALYKSIFDQ